jgi:hypothetical protein
MSDLINSIALANIGPGKGKDFVSPTGEQFITAGPTREEIKARAPERGVMGAINDNVIEVANAAAGGVSSIANMVSPGNRVSKFIEEEIIKPGEQSQSDQVKAEKKFLQQDMASAQGAGDEISAYLGYIARNPGLAISQVAGSFAIPGLAAKGASRLAGATGMGAGASSAVGLGATSVVSGAMAGGDAAGSAYDLVKRTPKKILQQNAEYQELLKTMGEAEALEEVATRAARSASVTPAAIGAVLGPLGAERILAGAGRPLTASRAKNAFLTGGVDAGTEGFEEGVTQYSGQKAAAEYNPEIDPMKGVAGAATMGAVMGAGPGIVLGGLQTPAVPNPLQPVVDQAQKPGSVLSRAVVSTGVADQPIVPPAAPAAGPGAAVDLISARVSAVESDLRSNATLEKIRSLTPDASSEFLYALNIAKNTGTRADLRELAITQVEQVLETAKSGVAFTMVPPEKTEPSNALTVPGQRGGGLAAQQGGPLAPNGMGGFFDPNVVDVEAVRVDNMLPGPRALEGPRARIGTDVSMEPQNIDTSEQPVDAIDTPLEANPIADSFAPEEQQTVAPATQEAPSTPAAPEIPAVKPEAGGTYAGNSNLPAATRKRAATLRQLADQGFETVERRGNEFFLKNSSTGQELKLDGMADSQLARNQIKQAIDAKANTAAASPLNDRAEPTAAQIAAGNYKKSDVIELNGMKIKIENPKSSIRRGTSPDGVQWETKMAHHYGEFQGTEGADGDKLDVFVGPRPDSSKVFVIDQVNEDGSFDEHKVMMGFTSEEAARAGYLANYEKGWTGLGAITEMPVGDFKAWAKSRAAKKPLAKLPGKPAAAAPSEKARWIKAILDNSRLAGDTGIQLDVTPDGKLNFLGDPNSSKQGRSLLATLAEAKKAGATNKEIADAIRASKAPATKSPIEQMRDDVDAQLQEPKGQFASLEDAKAYLSQQRRANGNVSGLPLQMADGSFGIAIKGSREYAEAERQRDEREGRNKSVKPQGEFFTVSDGGKQRKLKKVTKAAMPKKASPRRMGEPRELTQDEAGLIEQVAAVLGKTVVFFESQDGRIGDGFFLPNQPGVLYVATSTTVNPLAVFGHEFFHDLRESNPQAWNAIAAVVRTRVADPAGFRGDYAGKASTDGSALTEEKGGELEELVSDLGGNLMMDSTFWRDVFAKIGEDNGKDAKGIIARLAAALESLIARVMKAMGQPGFRADQFVTEIDAIRAAYKDGLANHIKAAGINKASMGAEVAKASQQLKKTPDRPAQPDSITVDGYHFSQAPRAVLTTGMFGTGLKGSARDQIMASDDDRIKQRLSFYVDKGTGIKPEAGVGAYAHKATLTNIYDGDADPLRLRSGNARAFESKVLDAGFSGYLARMDGNQSGQVVLLGAQTVQPELLGTGKVTGAKVVPEAVKRAEDVGDQLMANRALPSGMLSPQRWSAVLMAQNPELAAQLMDIGALEGDKGMYKDELAALARKLSGQIRKSADRAKSEYDAVVAQYKGTDSWMKAPDGAATKLSERQWVQVRTPAFKAWFGDWESAYSNGDLWSRDDVSKAVGANGEPLVVYHGTDKGGFTEFEAPGGTGRGDLGIWTTPDYGMARSYVRKGRAKDVDLSLPTQADLEEAGYEFIEEDGGIAVNDSGGYTIDGPADNNFKFRTIADAVAAASEGFDGEAGTTPGVYALFINTRNPNEENFEGAMWSGETEDKVEVLDENGDQVYNSNNGRFFDQDEADALVAEKPDYEIIPSGGIGMTTDDVVRDALRNNNDSAIIREVVDDGGGPGYFLDPQDIFVAFDPIQVKSADYNNGEFSDSTGDLRKTPDRVGDVERHNLVAQRGERIVSSRVTLTEEERKAISTGAKESGIPASEIEKSVRNTKAAHPASDGWAPLVFNRVKVEENDDGEKEVDFEYKAVPYAFNTDQAGKTLQDNSPEYQRAVTKVARNMVGDVRKVFDRSIMGEKSAKNIIEQAAWYKAMRTRLRQEFGGLGDLFADLLGATSPNTPVRGNWENSVDSLRRAMRGDFDQLMPKWQAWAGNLEAVESEFKDFFNAMVAQGMKKNKIKELNEYKRFSQLASEAREVPDSMLPTKESGKKYGFNGKNVIRAMVDLWRVVNDANPDIGRGGTAPKALNFSGNLIGFRSRATIDVWAARNLQRNAGKPRIPSVAESGVSGSMLRSGATTLQFGFGQDVFTKAVGMIRGDADMSKNNVLRQINDDDLQALVWFVEKEIWTKSNWTSAAGEGGSFEFESDLAGVADQGRVRELRRIADGSVAASREEKARAQDRIFQIADDLEPYQEAADAMASVSKTKKAVDAAKKNDGSSKALRKLAREQEKLEAATEAMNTALEELPKTQRSTAKVAAKIKEMRSEATRLANTFKKPLPEELRENREAALRELSRMARTVDRFIVGLSLATSSELQGENRAPTDEEQAAASKELHDAVYSADGSRSVLAAKFYSTEGRYGTSERSIDGEVIARDGFDAGPLAAKVFDIAGSRDQDSAFVARVLRPDEKVDPLTHRPGVEIYFRNAETAEQAEALMRRVSRTAVPRAGAQGDRRARFFRADGYTVIVDGRRTPEAVSGAMPNAVGMRIMYLPEFNARYGDTSWNSLTDDQIRDKITSATNDLIDFANRVVQKIPEVSFGGSFSYEVEARFNHEYQEAIDGNTNRNTEAASQGRGGKTWSGRSIREAVESAARRDGAESSQQERALPDRDRESGELRKTPDRRGDRGGRDQGRSLAPLEGAPIVKGATGPDPRLVEVAEQYARDNGISLRRQAEFVEVDLERAARIAQAYAAMPHAPQDPKVKEAYANLIRQTTDQYRALERAGYKFYLFDENSDPYEGNPWNAMRELRADQTMGVFATEAGFGSGVDFDPQDNPLLADTGIKWPYGSLDGKPKRVLANDLFRAVHDAFGHGIEGAGFRARGEENAWQAHARLFTGSAVGAITSETRGQNSWLNYGPSGDMNRDAKVFDTVFADQKTGLMPEWTWTEGRAGDANEDVAPTYNQRIAALKDLITCLKK